MIKYVIIGESPVSSDEHFALKRFNNGDSVWVRAFWGVNDNTWYKFDTKEQAQEAISHISWVATIRITEYRE